MTRDTLIRQRPHFTVLVAGEVLLIPLTGDERQDQLLYRLAARGGVEVGDETAIEARAIQAEGRA